MLEDGIKASELIKLLQQAINKYGGRPCFSGGTDYPAGVQGIFFRKNGDGYYSDKCLVIR